MSTLSSSEPSIKKKINQSWLNSRNLVEYIYTAKKL